MRLAGIDDGQVITLAIGDVQRLLVPAQGHTPRPPPHQHIVQYLAACHIHHCHVIRAAERNIGSASITGHDKTDRRHVFRPETLWLKVDLVDDPVVFRVDHGNVAGQFAAYPDFLSVGGQ